MSVLRLAIPSPLRRLFDYLPPQGVSEADIANLQPGQRVLVPFGPRRLTGYLVTVSEVSELPALASLVALLLLTLLLLLLMPVVVLGQPRVERQGHQLRSEARCAR